MSSAADSAHSRIAQRLLTVHDPGRKLSMIGSALPELRLSDPAAALELASEGYRIATSLRDFGAATTMLECCGRCKLALGRHDAALHDLEEAHRMFADQGMPAEAVAAALAIGNVHQGLGNSRDAMFWYETARDTGKGAGVADMQAAAVEAIGELRTSLGDYPTALELYHECHALRLHAGDIDGAGKALSAIGVICGLSGDFTGAFDYFSKGLAVFRQSGNRYEEVKALTNLGSIHSARGELRTAYEYFVKAMTIYEALGDSANAGRVLVMIGNVHEQTGRRDKALECQMRAFALVDTAEDNELRVAILLNIARLDMAADAPDEALFVLNQALEIATAINELRLLYEVHEALASVYEELGNPAAALDHHRRFARIRNDLAGREKQKSLAEFQARFDVALAEREREIYRLRAEALEVEMRLKKNELTAMALNLVQKKELLETMKGQLEALQRNSTGGGKVSIDKLVRDIEGAHHSDDEWKMFEQQLDNLHQDFIRTLSERFPTLTPTELKICSLTRINIQTKDIANLLFTSFRTVQVHKYNIRKKFGLPTATSLTTFLSGI